MPSSSFILRAPCRAVRQIALATLLVALSFRPAGGQTPVDPAPPGASTPMQTMRVGTAAVVERAPVIDGRLDDAAWRSATPLNGFVQRELHEGQPITERTDVRIVVDGEALYVAAWLYDREPALIVPGEKIRDVPLANSDYFAIILDTFLDRQNGFIFATTPAGVEYDGQVVKEGEGGGISVQGQTRAQSGSMGGFNLNWDGSWTVATSVDSLGWYAEFRIPFSTIRYAGGGLQTWGLNLARSIRRKNEEAFWSFIPRQFNLYRMSRAGTLQGVHVPTRHLATLTPYVLAGTSRDFATDPRLRRTGELGADAKLGVTPSLALDLTYNTDFAQVEVDEQRTNLTRFPLFFPEKRPFFLENAGVFSAGTPQAVDLFFTRRIGIDTLGRPVPIRAGARLTGRAAGFTLGMLEIVTERGSTPVVQPANSYTVARVVRELSSRSRLGALAVARIATDSAANRNETYAFDGRVGLGDDWTIDWWGAKTRTPGRTGDDLGYSVRTAYVTGQWNNNARIVQAGADLNPEVGFLNRTGGYRLYDATIMRLIRFPRIAWLKQWNPHVGYTNYSGFDGYWQSGRLHIDMTEIELASGGRFGPDWNAYHEGLQKPFTISPGVVLPAGPYNWITTGLDWSTDPSAPLSFLLRGDFGPFYDGTRNGGSVTFTYRRGASLTTALQFDYNDVRLEEGSFVRRLIGTRVGYFFTPRVFVQSLVQYNNQARVWAANARFGWLATAGTGLFVVLNDGEEADGFFQWGRPQSRSLVVKFTRQLGTGQ
jgi:hypothetical protein